MSMASTLSAPPTARPGTDLHVEAVTGERARTLLVDRDFREKWSALYDGCEWATPFQSPDFVVTWYETYRDRVRPVLLLGHRQDDTLAGLLALATVNDTSQVVVAGGHQAEYQVWLARQPHGETFPEAAFHALSGIIGDAGLTFRYLPPQTPVEWVGRSRVAEMHVLQRPEMRVDAAAAQEALDKRRYRTRLTKLAKLGELRFERLESAEALAAVFDQIETLYDLRQGGIGASLAFAADPLKRALHLNLIRHRGLLHATALRVGSSLIAAHMGIAGRGGVYLGTLAHSPLYAKDSPGRLQVMLLARLLAEEGYEFLDLTPGDDPWKEPFATSHQQVMLLSVRGGRRAFVRHAAAERMSDAARWGLRKLGFSPGTIRNQLENARARGIVRLGRAALRRARRWIAFNTELRLYSFSAAEARTFQKLNGIERNRLEHLLEFEETEDRPSKGSFLKEALVRLEQGHHVYTQVERGRLIHHGWMAERQEITLLSEVHQTFTLPPGSAVLYDFYTHPSARGRGLYQASMRQMLHDAASVPGTERVFIFVEADNLASRHAIEKLGFRYEGSLFEKGLWGRTSRWQDVVITNH